MTLPTSRYGQPLRTVARDPRLDLATHIGQRSSTFRFDLVDGLTGEALGEVNPRRDTTPTLAHDTTATIKRSLSLELEPDDTARVDTIRHRILPRMVLEDGTTWPLGRYMFAASSRQLTTAGRRSSPALKDEMLLVDTELEETFSPPVLYDGDDIPIATTGVDVAIGMLLDGLPVTTRVDPTPYWTVGAWRAGTSRGQVLGDLALEGDYFAPWFGHDGVLRVVRAFDPASRPPDLDLDAEQRVIRDSIVESDNLLDAPNRWIVISNGSASDSESEAPIVGTYDVPDSAPHSARNRGFVVPTVRDMQVDTPAQAQAIAANLGQRETLYEVVELSTPPDPRHDSYQVIRWDARLWLEIGWSMALVEGGEMRHTLRRAYGD